MSLPRDLSGEEVVRLLGRHYGYRVRAERELAKARRPESPLV